MIEYDSKANRLVFTADKTFPNVVGFLTAYYQDYLDTPLELSMILPAYDVVNIYQNVYHDGYTVNYPDKQDGFFLFEGQARNNRGYLLYIFDHEEGGVTFAWPLDAGGLGFSHKDDGVRAMMEEAYKNARNPFSILAKLATSTSGFFVKNF